MTRKLNNFFEICSYCTFRG